MKWFALSLLLFGAKVSATVTLIPLHYTSFCEALLEVHFRPTDGTVTNGKEINSLLEQVATIAKARVAKFERDGVKADDVESEKPDSISIHTEDRDATLTKTDMTDEMRQLRWLPERIEDLHVDLNSVRADTVASGYAWRGADAIREYFFELARVSERNENELLPIARKELPYGRASRIAKYAVSGYVPWMVLLYGVEKCVQCVRSGFTSLPPATAGLVLVTTGIAAAVIRAMNADYLNYVHGFFSARAREKFESTAGLRRLRATQDVGDLIDHLPHAAKFPREFHYVFRRRIFSETEMEEIKRAAIEKRLPSLDFIREHEKEFIFDPASNEMIISNIKLIDEPLTHSLVRDTIYFYDDKAEQPVLMRFLRFVRNEAPITSPPVSRDDNQQSPLDGYLPVGAR